MWSLTFQRTNITHCRRQIINFAMWLKSLVISVMYLTPSPTKHAHAHTHHILSPHTALFSLRKAQVMTRLLVQNVNPFCIDLCEIFVFQLQNEMTIYCARQIRRNQGGSERKHMFSNRCSMSSSVWGPPALTGCELCRCTQVSVVTVIPQCVKSMGWDSIGED